ncbi:MAG: hypothetical protein ACTSWG_10450 [Candidatus Helarchaeota archaeon]
MEFYKGDTIKIQCTIDEDITDWKIRASITDASDNEVKIATLNSGGADTQIAVTPGASESTFILYFASGDTDDFEENAILEIEVDTGETINGKGEIYTLFQGNITLKEHKIDWTSP